jgi:hypothetical protein
VKEGHLGLLLPFMRTLPRFHKPGTRKKLKADRSNNGHKGVLQTLCVSKEENVFTFNMPSNALSKSNEVMVKWPEK